jgi:EAL domain-containing protein (putative c-di-GMP-specific phosphodiesterase class I)
MIGRKSGLRSRVAQGNYLGEPMPADRIAALLRNNIQFSAI